MTTKVIIESGLSLILHETQKDKTIVYFFQRQEIVVTVVVMLVVCFYNAGSFSQILPLTHKRRRESDGY